MLHDSSDEDESGGHDGGGVGQQPVRSEPWRWSIARRLWLDFHQSLRASIQSNSHLSSVSSSC